MKYENGRTPANSPRSSQILSRRCEDGLCWRSGTYPTDESGSKLPEYNLGFRFRVKGLGVRVRVLLLSVGSGKTSGFLLNCSRSPGESKSKPLILIQQQLLLLLLSLLLLVLLLLLLLLLYDAGKARHQDAQTPDSPATGRTSRVAVLRRCWTRCIISHQRGVQ